MKQFFRVVPFICLWSFSHHALAQDIDIQLIGIDEEQKLNIMASLSLNKAQSEETLSASQIELLYQKAFQEIKISLQPFGYYHAQVEGELKTQKNTSLATYTISLGEPTRVDEFSFKLEGPGKVHPGLSKIPDEFPLRPGDVFSHKTYEKGKALAQQSTYQQGYIKAYFSTHQVTVSLQDYSADFDLVLNTGEQYTLGDMSFSESFYDPKFIAQFAHFSVHEPYLAETLVNFEGRLMQSGLFKQVEIKPNIQEDSTQVPIHIKLEDAAANRYLFGVGYDTNTRARVRAGWDRKKINDQGHQLKTQFKMSEKDTLFDAAYIIPGYKPWVDNYQLAFNYADDEYKDRPSELYTFALSETKEFKHYNRTLAIRYLSETFTDSDGIKERSTFLLPSISFSRSSMDNVVNPTRGYKAELTIRGGMDAIFSNADFVQVHGRYRYLKALTKYNTLITRLELGATIPEDVERLPLSIRYYAGGIESLRGYAYRSVPFEINEDGELEPVGGAYLAIGSLEVDQTLWGPLKAAVFVDGGGAFRKVSDDWKLSAGVGLRWQTPVGPLKIDFAKPLTEPNEDWMDGWRVHFSFGPQL